MSNFKFQMMNSPFKTINYKPLFYKRDYDDYNDCQNVIVRKQQPHIKYSKTNYTKVFSIIIMFIILYSLFLFIGFIFFN